MKKLLILLVAVICVISSFCFGCQGSGNSKEIKVSGEEVSAFDLRTYVAKRQETYLEADTANESAVHWFDFDFEMTIKTTQKMDNDKLTDITIEYEMSGKMGVDYSAIFTKQINLLYDLDVKMKAQNEYVDETGEKQVESLEMKGELIFVEGVAYADLKVTQKIGENEQTQKQKVKGDIGDILDMELDEIGEIFGSTNFAEGRLYGISVDTILDNFASRPGVHYYLDEEEETFYLEQKQNEENENTKMDLHLQYEIEFENESAAVKKERYYINNYNYISYAQGEKEAIDEYSVKAFGMIKKISPISITAPEDADSYTKI